MAVAANPAMAALAAWVDPALLEAPVNVMRVGLHPRGLASRMINLGEVRAHFLGRLRRQVAIVGDEDLAALLAEVEGYPAPAHEHDPACEMPAREIITPLCGCVPPTDEPLQCWPSVSREVEQFDVVVVGARCAGSPLATMLARRGLRVCLLDGSRFPSDTLSTHVIQPCGVSILDRLGVLDAVLKAGAVPLTRFTILAEDARIEAKIEVEAFGAPGLCVRRVTLDHLLAAMAASAGAEVRTGTRVTNLLQEDGRVAGVETEQHTLARRWWLAPTAGARRWPPW